MLEFLLMVVAYIVFLLVFLKRNAWGWIVLYWALVCVKNASVLGGGN